VWDRTSDLLICSAVLNRCATAVPCEIIDQFLIINKNKENAISQKEEKKTRNAYSSEVHNYKKQVSGP
jgi:hypothetical protein